MGEGIDSFERIDWTRIQAVITDVDETLIDVKSMFSILDVYALMTSFIDPDAIRQRMRMMADSGCSRDEVNRYYYSCLAGLDPDVASRCGRTWFAARRAVDGFWIEPARKVIETARQRGLPVALVTGSHRACIDPIAQVLGIPADDVLCTELVVGAAGLLTGERERTCVGEGKRARVLEWAREARIDLKRTIGMGDHHSDLAFLELVGHPVAVCPSPQLREHAREHRWMIVEPEL